MTSLFPHGPDADRIAGLFWLMLTLGGVIYMVVMTLLVVALFKRRSSSEAPSRGDNAFIVTGGVIVPTIVLAVLAVATVRVTNRVTAPRANPVKIDVVGYQYWWRVDYAGADGTRVTTANEIHIPVGRPVQLGLTSVDVNHSLWVPDLAGKVDLIPGQRNVLSLQADQAGTYRGQCAEFCGLQHTHMAFLVIAEPAAAFDTWLSEQARPATATTGLPGQAVFDSLCAGCHTVRGTGARGQVGPDLTHLMARSTIGAVTARNTHDNLAAWVANAQSMKDGALMPPIPMNGAELDDLITYLETLR